MLDATTVVTSIIRPSEKVKLVIDTYPGSGRVSSSGTGTVRRGSVLSTRRVIAVITREDGGKEHGGLFIYKWTREDPPSLVLVTILAITPDFRVDLALLTSSQQPPAADPGTEVVPMSRADCVVDIHSDGMEFSFVCDEAQATQLRSESERLKKFESSEDEAPSQTHSWMAVYRPKLGDRRLISQYTRPYDLRDLYREPALSHGYAGNPGDEEVDAILIRDDWIRKTVYSRKDTFSTTHKLRVRVGTFNVNGKNPDASIRAWVQGREEGKTGLLDDPDMLFFGFQELDLSTGALLYSTSNLLETAWTSSIFSALGEKAGNYVKFASHQLVGMLILGFVRRGQRPYISEISTASIGVGIMGIMGNKGAVGIRFRFRHTIFTCVASHLAANDGLMEKRNSDYREIAHRLQFPLHAATPAEAAEQLNPVSSSIFESDVLIWMVNLNYRIEIPYGEVMEMTRPPMKAYNVPVLMEFDELSISKSNHLAFELFEESPITFPPTYRYFVNSGSLDIMRRPAWTDRILHMSSPASFVQQTVYSSHPEILLSDHKPVSADFIIETRTVDPELHSKVIIDTLRLVQTIGAIPDSPPKLRVESRTVSFGKIHYMQPLTQVVDIENTTSIACAFRMLPAQEGGSITPQWLTADIQYGLLLPSGRIRITLTALVDKNFARTIDPKVHSLETTIILHVEHGLDHFIVVNADFQPTCFAKSLDYLTHLPKSVRQSDGVATLNDNQAANIPRELMRIIDWLMTHPLHSRFNELFASSSSQDLLLLIREDLDTGDEFKFGDSARWTEEEITLAFGETLIYFLDSLVEPIVPESVHVLIGSSDSEDDGEFLDALPHVSVNVWVTLFAFLQFASNQSGVAIPEIDQADRIAATFAPILIRDRPDMNPEYRLSPLQKRAFLKRFLMV
ncbi:hypothetical protein M408DRAFT_234635 [Serendipita vermifera MAFF 305830]|uniref:Rho-GAP domain-containing protein n=1 Tax=Serendipita vermifera MAFF 305830 TaxID=933852 RepID=A0A0C2WCZ2_SERVB|nr:hypothetical protein M408DRAFT_234635 [Serendipita vermifera MAFF 305830]